MNTYIKKYGIYLSLFIVISISLILFLILWYIIKPKNKYTYEFTNRTINKPIIQYISNNEVIRALSSNNYFNHFNYLDLKYRKLDQKNNQDLIYYYKKAIIPANDHIKKRMNTSVQYIVNKLKENNNYKYIFNTPWKFAFFKNLENNFPHTHHDFIMIPILNVLITSNITLLHEYLHVIQRKYSNLFKTLYTKYWYFEYAPIKGLSRIERKARTNPDGLDNNWIFTYKKINIVLIALYDNDANTISDVIYYGIYVIKNNDNTYSIPHTIRKKELKDIPEFVEFFNMNHNIYHPNELSVDIISNHCLNSSINVSPAYNAFKLWWNSIDNNNHTKPP